MSSSSSSCSNITDLKRRALALKKAGDVNGAIQLLRQAKQLEHEQQQKQEQLEAPTTNDDRPPDQDAKAQQEATLSNYSSLAQKGPSPSNGTAEQSKEEGEAATTLDVLEDTTEEEIELGDLLLDNKDIVFTDEEMADEEMMTEFKLGGMPVPSNEEYAAKILALKKKALGYKKSGNIQQAKQYVARAKQLEKVQKALSHMQEGLGLRIHDDKDGWLEELNDPDSALVGEALGCKQNVNDENNCMALDIDDLETMDHGELLDAVEMGMELPSVEKVLEGANEKKAMAVQLKQQGDLDGAKNALYDYKRLQGTALKLESLQKHKKGDEEEISMQALESLLEGDNGNKKATGQEKQKHEPKIIAPTKSAEELKQEVVRLRDENNLKEATQVFKAYKEALQKEKDTEEKKRCLELIESIRKEMQLGKQQQRLFQFYQRFVDAQVGATQLAWWNDYIKTCEDATKQIEAKGIPVTVSRTTKSGALFIEEDELVDILESGMGASEERLEVAIVDVRNLRDNKVLQKLLRKSKEGVNSCHIVQVVVSLQIPPSQEERDKFMELVFESSPSEECVSDYCFETPQYVKLPRGDSKYVETLQRRMEQRKIQVCVYHVPHKNRGWFGGWSSGNKAQENPPTLVGKVVLELKNLLRRNCVAGDFELRNTIKAVGGTVGLVVRTGVPFDTNQLETTVPEATLSPFKAMLFATEK